MTLRSKVFFLFSTLLAILLGSQWFMMRSITNDVSRELGQVAFSVARDTATFFILGNFNWNQQLTASVSFNRLVVDRTTKITSKVKIQELGDNKSHEGILAENTFIYRPPSVEIRLNNQVEDNFLELITAAGTQSIPIERQNMIDTVNKLQSRMLIGTLIILVFGLIVAAYFSHRLSAPLRELSETAELVASGDLGATIDHKGNFISGEIRSTIESFNHMSRQLLEINKLKARVRENEHYRELGEIASGLAHSIRNPLNTLGLTIEELSRNDLKSERRSSLVESATRQINRVDNWIRSFMTFSLQSNTQHESIDIVPIIQDIQLEVSQLEQRKVSIDIQSALGSPIIGVEAELKAILHALIINAVEASPDGATVHMQVSESDSEVNIEIIDDGSGLPEEIIGKLFMPHQTTKQRGSGMGLFIAHRLITNRYQGTIDINNRIDDDGMILGTKVSLSLAKNRVIS